MKLFRLIGLTLGAAALLAASACSDLTKTEEPQLIVKIDEEEIPAHVFPKIDPNATPKKAKIKVQNGGGEALVIYNVYLEEGGNQYISISWDGVYTPTDFPIVIEPGYSGTKFDFHVQYDPEQDPVDISDTVLVLETNDGQVADEDNGETIPCPDWPEAPYNGGPDLGFKVAKPNNCSAHRTPFEVEKIGPVILLNAESLTFSCVVGSKTQIIEIDNEGTADLVIDSIGFDFPTTEFTISNPPALPVTIPPKGDPNYFTLAFEIFYQPLDDDYDDSNLLRILSNATNTSSGNIFIEIEIVQKPAVLQMTTTSPFGYLDFSENNDHSLNMYNKKPDECNELCPDKGECCGCPVLIQSVRITPPEAADWYTFTVWDPNKDKEVIIGSGKSLAAGKAFDFNIHYAKPAGQPADMNGNFCIDYIAPGIGANSQCVNMLASSQCDLELGPANAQLNFNSISPQDEKSKYVALINKGNAPCTVNSVVVTDKWSGLSEDFALAEEWTPGATVEGFTIETVEVRFSPHSMNLQGFLKVDYEHPLIGQTEKTFQLNGYSEPECLVPIADLGSPDNYAGYIAGSTIVVNACSSGEGDCGDPIYENGYIWLLLDKPAGSAAHLNTEASCTSAFYADQAGTYTVGLVVYEASSQMFLQSEPVSVDIEVAAAPEE